MKHRFLTVAALFLAVGCGGPHRKVVGVVPKSTSHIFWVAVERGAKAAARDFNLELIWNGPPSETDYARQIQIVDSLIARHVDGLVLAATERQALVGPVDRAMAAGIPVAIFDSGLDSTNYTSFVATNNYAAGRLAAAALGKLLGGRGSVGIVMHVPGSVSTMDRERGFEDALAGDYPNVKIVARQYGMSTRARSRDATENILTAHPDLDGLFASTEPSSSGASLALASRGLAGKVKFVAFDTSDSMVEDLKRGTIHAMVVQDPFKIGYEAVRTIADKLNGKTPPKRIDLDGVLVTRPDLEKPEVRALLGLTVY